MLLVPMVAFAAELDPAEAERIARLYYALTGQPVPSVIFLQDDVAVLQESGRDADELERAVRWIALTIPGAKSYTLSGILESHLAEALGEEEILVDPLQDERGDQILGEVVRPELWTPSAAFKQEVLVAFYEGTGREAPDPPHEADLLAFQRLVWEGWSPEGIALLGSWIPDNVKGAEQLSFAEVAEVAVTKGYNGGPRPDGDLEVLEGVRPPLIRTLPDWIQDRDPRAWDGGSLRSTTTLGTLPSALEFGAQAARLPGLDLRVAEVDLHLHGMRLGVGESSSRSGFAAQVLLQDSPPGMRDDDGISLDGGPPRRPASLPEHLASGGRIGAGWHQGPLSVGAALFGYDAGDWTQLGASGSVRLGGPTFGVLQELSLATETGSLSGLLTEGQRLSYEVSPLWTDGRWTAQVRLRGIVAAGVLREVVPTLIQDGYWDRGFQAELALRQQGPHYAWGLGASGELSHWDLDWKLAERPKDTVLLSDSTRELALQAGGELQLPIASDLWISGGLRSVVGSTPGLEAALGARMLLKDRLWVGVGLRAGREPQLQLSLGLPL